jgi:hypothetical protein
MTCKTTLLAIVSVAYPALLIAAGLGFNPGSIVFPDDTAQTSASFPPLPAKMVWVAPENGDYALPTEAMANLADWCGVPSESNPCVILIAPGVYDLGDAQLRMQPWVTIQGSGQDSTIIRGHGSTW